MKINKISFAHKNRLILLTKMHQGHEEIQHHFEINAQPLQFCNSKEHNRFSLNYQEKQNKKPLLNQLPNNCEEKLERRLKFRSYSTNIGRKLFQPLYHSKQQIRQEKPKQPNDKTFFESIVHQMIEEMRRKLIILDNHQTSFTIKKEQLQNLLSYLISSVGFGETECRTEDFSYLSHYLQQIGCAIIFKKNETLKQKSKLQSSILSHQISHKDFIKETLKRKTEIQCLLHDKQKLIEQVNTLKNSQSQITKQYHQKQLLINEEMKIIHQNKESIKSYENEINHMKIEMERYDKEVSKVKEASEQIENYVNNQKNKLIIMASEDYKAIESEIYDYAAYLQCNQLASSLSYEPLSITCITNDLEEQLKVINRTLIQNEEIDPKQKSKLMRDFLLQWMNRFKKKDDEQRQVIKFKTKCVQTFIQKMQKWLDNWTLKQEYLVGLRNQFSVDTIKLKELINEIASNRFCEECIPILRSLHENIEEIYQKIENNYKLGNSFY